jgi:ribose transport system permease protein
MKVKLKQIAFDYGMIFVLLLLCTYFSASTVQEQFADGPEAAKKIGKMLNGQKVLVVIRDSEEHSAFGKALKLAAEDAGNEVLAILPGEPSDARKGIEALIAAGKLPTVITGPQATMQWDIFNPDYFKGKFPELTDTSFIAPQARNWPTFLTRQNLLNVATQIVVIAVIAIGMTMVIITAGIDLSVGSLIALAATIAASIIHAAASGGDTAAVGAGTVVFACVTGIVVCGLFGLFSGVITAMFHVPSFIVTLAVMMMARGFAYKATDGQALSSLPPAFGWLGHTDIAGIPLSVLLMVGLYAVAHFVMSQTVYGRYIYALGGNEEAARLSGVPVKRILISVYTICGLLAGLGGIILASELTSGDPKTGQFYELYVIAAVVVGGTSLMGGQGKILGTLIGALIIGVVRNGMNLMGVSPFNQYIVFGLIILLAVLAEKLKTSKVFQSRKRILPTS